MILGGWLRRVLPPSFPSRPWYHKHMADYTLNPDGTATFEFDEFTRVLRRPTLRQYRTSLESLGAMREQALEAQEPDGESVSINTVGVQLDLVIAWFDETFKDLAGEGLPRTEDDVVDEDKLPPWLLNAELIGKLVTHWQTNPSRRGAR